MKKVRFDLSKNRVYYPNYKQYSYNPGNSKLRLNYKKTIIFILIVISIVIIMKLLLKL